MATLLCKLCNLLFLRSGNVSACNDPSTSDTGMMHLRQKMQI